MGKPPEPSARPVRQLDDSAVLDHLADGGVLCLQADCIRPHLHALGDIAQLQPEVHAELLGGLKNEARDVPRLESLRFALDCIFANLDQGEEVLAGVIGNSGAALFCRDARDRYVGAWNHGATRVGNYTCDLCRSGLRPREAGQQD
jgi:hypothetical protein